MAINGDSGPNTFRAAIEKANRDSSVKVIRFRPELKYIGPKTPITDTDSRDLKINGTGATVTRKGSPADLLIANGGGDLHLENISFTKALRSGVVVNVPAGGSLCERTVSLRNVVLKDNGWYGLHFDDQSGGGGIFLAAFDLEASKNADENIKATQLQDGSITAILRTVTVKKAAVETA